MKSKKIGMISEILHFERVLDNIWYFYLLRVFSRDFELFFLQTIVYFRLDSVTRTAVICPIIDVISDNDFAYLTGSDMTWVSWLISVERISMVNQMCLGWIQLAIKFPLVCCSTSRRCSSKQWSFIASIVNLRKSRTEKHEFVLILQVADNGWRIVYN